MPALKQPSEDTLAFIREHFWYDKARGRVEWLTPPENSRAMAGSDIGTIRADGYRYVYIKGRMVSVLSIAVYLRDGRWPEGRVKPVNGHRDDLRPENLLVGSIDYQGAMSAAKRVRDASEHGSQSADPFARIPKAERLAIIRDLDLSRSDKHNDPVFRRHALVNALDWLVPGGYRRRFGYQHHTLDELERVYTLFS